jgi:hypothetical protein
MVKFLMMTKQPYSYAAQLARLKAAKVHLDQVQAILNEVRAYEKLNGTSEDEHKAYHDVQVQVRNVCETLTGHLDAVQAMVV